MDAQSLVKAKETIVAELKTFVSEDQIVTEHEALYDAGADRYRKYEKAKGF